MGSNPAVLTLRKGKPTGDGSRPENGRAMSLEGSTPSPSACALGRVAKALVHQTSQVGSIPTGHSRGSANGRLPVFEPGDGGSIPSPRTFLRLLNLKWKQTAGQLLLVRNAWLWPRRALVRFQPPQRISDLGFWISDLSRLSRAVVQSEIENPKSEMFSGSWSNRKTPVLQTGDSGAIPGESTGKG